MIFGTISLIARSCCCCCCCFGRRPPERCRRRRRRRRSKTTRHRSSFREEEEEEEEEEEACVTFFQIGERERESFLFGDARKFPTQEGTSSSLEKNDDGQKVRARVGLEHRFSFLSSSMSRGEDRRHRFPFFASRSLVFFRATRFYAGERALLRAKVVAADSLSLSFSLSLSLTDALPKRRPNGFDD